MGDRINVPPLTILTGAARTAWGWDGLAPIATLAGIPVVGVGAGEDATPGHPNGVGRVDHVVLTTPTFDATIDELVDAGLEVRRVREVDLAGAASRQGFVWVGDTILEVVGPATPGDGGPALWGIAFESPDLDATRASLGDRCGPVRDAVQPGRRIATLRTAGSGISLAVSVMSPHEGGDANLG